jgi:hypothetical protein
MRRALLWLAVVGAVVAVVIATRGAWVAAIGRSLACAESVQPSDLVLIENFDPNYVLFEKAAALARAGVAPRALIPVERSRDPGRPNPVALGVAGVMAGQARLARWEVLPIALTEPISLNAARQVREHLVREGVGSVIVVAPGFRSRRSALVYRAVLGDAVRAVHCVPVFGRVAPERWASSWHGVQEVVLEFLKLQYYRFYVLPFRAGEAR